MASYDYEAGRERIDAILDNKLDVVETDIIPNDQDFTFENGYYGWVTGVFVDIRDSSTLFADGDKEKVSKIVRCFTSEIIEILRGNDNEREIGIRGDCVSWTISLQALYVFIVSCKRKQCRLVSLTNNS